MMSSLTIIVTTNDNGIVVAPATGSKRADVSESGDIADIDSGASDA